MLDRHDSVFTRKGAVTTSSRLKMWYMVNVKKWTVSHHVREPVRVSLGQMVYKETWILMPPGSNGKNGANGK